jgi:effector-binding domain-containing protein
MCIGDPGNRDRSEALGYPPATRADKETLMAYDVTIERTTERPTAVVKAGHNVMLYRTGPGEGEVAVEVGVQVTRSFEAAGRVVPSTLPAGEAAVTVHTGTPAEIGAAHDAVVGWCTGDRRELTGVRWEIYGDPDPQTGHFDVAVYWQLA